MNKNINIEKNFKSISQISNQRDQTQQQKLNNNKNNNLHLPPQLLQSLLQSHKINMNKSNKNSSQQQSPTFSFINQPRQNQNGLLNRQNHKNTLQQYKINNIIRQEQSIKNSEELKGKMLNSKGNNQEKYVRFQNKDKQIKDNQNKVNQSDQMRLIDNIRNRYQIVKMIKNGTYNHNIVVVKDNKSLKLQKKQDYSNQHRNNNKYIQYIHSNNQSYKQSSQVSTQTQPFLFSSSLTSHHQNQLQHIKSKLSKLEHQLQIKNITITHFQQLNQSLKHQNNFLNEQINELKIKNKEILQKEYQRYQNKQNKQMKVIQANGKKQQNLYQCLSTQFISINKQQQYKSTISSQQNQIKRLNQLFISNQPNQPNILYQNNYGQSSHQYEQSMIKNMNMLKIQQQKLIKQWKTIHQFYTLNKFININVNRQ